MIILAKYNTALTIRIPLIKASSNNFAVSADYTHSSGDVKISKDGGAAATATNSPSALTMGNGGIWTLTLTATEMSAEEIVVTFIDATTKAIEDQCVIIHTYGHASARHAADLDDSVRLGLTALPNAAAEASGGLFTRGTGAGQINQDANGRIDTNVAAISTDSTAADNAEAMFDGTGYAGGTIRLKTDGPFRKNTALAGFTFMMINSTDDISGKTGLTVTATRSIDGAAFASCANSVSEVSNGLYKIDLAAADLNGDTVTLRFTATGANPTELTIVTTP